MYFEELLKRFNMDKSKATDNPMATSCNMDKDDGGKPDEKEDSEV